MVLIELVYAFAIVALSLLSLCGLAIAGLRDDWGFLPWLSIYALGFGGVAWASITQSRR
jgi:hypothetical protein